MAETLEQGFKSWLRRTSRPVRQSIADKTIRCNFCDEEIPDATEEIYAEHVKTRHAGFLEESPSASDEKDEKAGFDSKIRALWKTLQAGSGRSDGAPCPPGPPGPPGPPSAPSAKDPANGKGGKDPNEEQGTKGRGGDPSQTPRRAREPVQSPASSLKREGSRSPSPPKRSKAKPTAATSLTTPDPEAGFDRRPPTKGTLWTPGSEQQRPRPADKANIAATHRTRPPNPPPRTPRPGQPPPGGAGAATAYGPPGEDTTSVLIKQPETRPISQEQLVTEVKGIYAGLVMVESKCIEVDNAQNAQTDVAGSKLNNEQWQALIALHRTLLHEHHDFFLASQHPSASQALRRLASKYAMPARMWRHGIHSFLELLRHRLPASLEHMLTFIYLAYSMMALLYETVPAFEDTWIECLGDLGRYRMAIEDDDIRHREVWTDVSRHWYSKASDKAPTTGRLYHHLAILARPNALQQLFYYTKALCVPIQFESARDSIMTLFDPIMALASNESSRLPPTELEFVRCHGVMFSKKYPEKYEKSADEFINSLDNHIARTTRRFLEPCYYIGISACCAIAGYGDEKNPIFKAIKHPRPADQPTADSEMLDELPKETKDAINLANRTHGVILKRFGDTNILPYLHVTLVFMYHLTFLSEVIDLVAQEFPWKLTALMLNTLLDSFQAFSRIEDESFPDPETGASRRPLPEDYAMRGLLWVDRYYPDDFFSNDQTDDDEKYMEMASMYEERKERVLYLGCRIAARGGKWLRYERASHRFSVAPEFDIELEGLSLAKDASIDQDLGELPDAAPEAALST